jgi:hypothetical protein
MDNFNLAYELRKCTECSCSRCVLCGTPSCYECTGYGDDYFVNKDGELESACPTCPHNRVNFDEDWDD